MAFHLRIKAKVLIIAYQMVSHTGLFMVPPEGQHSPASGLLCLLFPLHGMFLHWVSLWFTRSLLSSLFSKVVLSRTLFLTNLFKSISYSSFPFPFSPLTYITI